MFLKRSQKCTYSHVLNAAQSGSIAAFFTKCSYKSQPIGVKKRSYKGSRVYKNAAIGPRRGLLSHRIGRIFKRGYINAAQSI